MKILIIDDDRNIVETILISFQLQWQEVEVLSAPDGERLLYRYNPDLKEQGLNPLTLDSKEPSIPLEEYTANETRFTMLRQSDAPRAGNLLAQAQQEVWDHWQLYRQMAEPTRGN